MFSILYFSIKFLISESLCQFKNSCLIILYVSQFSDKISYSFYQMFLWSTFIFIFLNILINQRSLRSLSIICNIWIIYLFAANVHFFLLIIGHVASPVCMSNYSFIIWQKLCLEEPQNLQMMFSSTRAVFPFLFLGRWEADNLKLIWDSAGLGLGWSFSRIYEICPSFISISKPWNSLDFDWETSRSLSSQPWKNTRSTFSYAFSLFSQAQKTAKKFGKCLQRRVQPCVSV